MNRGYMPNRPFGMGNPAPHYGQFVPVTNKSFVSSLEEALSRYADYNSDMVYFDENKDVMYNICTNGRGDKSWTILDISVAKMPKQAQPEVAADPMAIVLERLDKLDKQMEVLNGKYNEKSANVTTATAGPTTDANG